MRRARLLSCAAFAALSTLAAPAAAFHAGISFTDPVARGGAGLVFYLGQRREHGWTCTMCHEGAPGKLKLAVTSDPPELGKELRWEPEVRYTITVRMIAEGGERGQASALANYNGIALTFEDDKGEPIGKPSGAADVFQDINFTHLYSVGTNPGETAWTFTWLAPAAGAGRATLRLAVVDGDAGGSQGGEAAADPFGDDVIVTALRLAESGTVARDAGSRDAPAAQRSPAHPGPAEARRPGPLAWISPLIVAFVLSTGLARKRAR